MNKEEVLNMIAGREMDYFIAEKVFQMDKIVPIVGSIITFENDEYLWRDWEVPHFSDDIESAWMVIDHMIGTHRSRPKISRVAENEWMVKMDHIAPVAYADAVPLAICKAALLTLL